MEKLIDGMKWEQVGSYEEFEHEPTDEEIHEAQLMNVVRIASFIVDHSDQIVKEMPPLFDDLDFVNGVRKRRRWSVGLKVNLLCRPKDDTK